MIRFEGVYANRILQRPISAIILLLFLAAATAAFGSTPTLDRISCVHTTVNYAGTDTCRAFLTGTTSQHLYIGLSSNNSAVVVPSTIMVSLNADSKGFTANIASVKTKQTATITATLSGIAKTFTIYLVPTTTAGTASLSVNATSIGFGSVIVNTPQEQAVTLTSTGTAAVTVNSASVSGTGFSLSGGAFPATLNPGQSTTLQVQFDPTKAGSYSGQLTVNSASTKTIPLSGVGAAHQVELSWNAPNATSDPVIGYNVYRSPSATTSYVRLNGSTETGTAYTDGTVQSSTSYKYIVKSVDAAGVESPASNATTVTVP